MALLKSLAYPEEIVALLKFKFLGCDAILPKSDDIELSDTLQTCYKLLDQTSRSFAAVIKTLDKELRDAVCIFYLVLRALDTIEDDASLPKDGKIPLLKSFHTKLQDPEWNKTDSQDKHRMVLVQFPDISKEFRHLDPQFQSVISKITLEMGEGMALYLDKGVESMEDFDEYCHYVAGLVGVGMVGLFVASGLEDDSLGDDLDSANRVGLFLQKTNIIRDYLADIRDGRIFWPKCVWSKYVNDIGDFVKPEHRVEAVHCLNELITNALELVPDALLCLSRVRNVLVPSAVPQVMAIATLERCYNNPEVFTSVVKIRKGEAVRLMTKCSDMNQIKSIFRHYITKIVSRIPVDDPSSTMTRLVCHNALKLTEGCTAEYKETRISTVLFVLFTVIASVVVISIQSL